MAYSLPGISVTQLFTQLPTATVRNLYAFVFGPNYRLFRYANASEKVLSSITSAGYDGTAFAATWPSLPANSVPDTAYAKVYADNAQLVYKTGVAVTEVAGTTNQLQFGITLAGHGADSALPARGVIVGDYVRFTDAGTTYLRKIVGLAQPAGASSIGAISANGTNTSLASNDLQTSGTFTGVRTSSFRFEVLTSGNLTHSVTATSNPAGEPDTWSAATGVLTGYVGDGDGEDWSAWGVGADDVYTLTCTTAGDYGVATFSVASANFGALADVTPSAQNTAFVIDADHGVYGTFTAVETGGYDAIAEGDQFRLTVKANYPRVKLTDTFTGASATAYLRGDAPTAYTVGPVSGVTVTLADTATPLIAGDLAWFAGNPATPGPLRIAVLDENIPAGVTVTSVDLVAELDGIEIPAENETVPGTSNWTVDAAGIDVSGDVAIKVPALVFANSAVPTCAIAYADLFLQYRALMLDYTQDVTELEDISDVEDMLGPIDPDNPLALNVWIARLNSGTRPVKFMACAGASADAWSNVLARVANINTVYAFAPASSDATVHALLKAHILAQSGDRAKRWRIGFVGSADPATAAVYTAATNPTGENYLAKLENGVLTFVTESGDTDTTVRCLTLSPGDEVRIDFSVNAVTQAETYMSYTIERALTNSTLALVGGTDIEDIPAGVKVEVYHNRSYAQQAEAVAGQSAAFHNRRMYHVFGGNAVTSQGFVVGNEVLASAVAGLCSSVVPQQGLTNIELNGITGTPRMYRGFTSGNLDTMAESGTLLITQDYLGGPVYVRHQLSTATIDGNLNTTELSLVKNMDSCSYFLSERLRGLIGPKNVTPELIARLEVLATDGLAYLVSNTDVGDVGPQLLGDNTKLNSVYQDPVLKDSVNMDFDLEFPKPFNTLNITLRAV